MNYDKYIIHITNYKQIRN